ncbi:serine hydrolase domain-containing protein [Lutibacter citreus]|uniref:serine hydrolase domain-containing protein n=1 Tax=Lutibacter citreus TaxID=2138210 RepID=UPI000DBE2D33|nr:serine hydrolase domain-containing protein [Lutibacter citreus]
MKNLIKFSLVCLFITCLYSCKDTKTNSDINTYGEFIHKMNDKGFTTGNILVYENGKIVYQNSNGLRTIDTKEPLTLNSQFRLASVSKQFTGMAIMKLKEAGKIEYDQTVTSILPEFPYKNITVRHLLHHISGLTDYERLIDENWKPEDSTKTYILGNDEIIKVFYSVNPKLDFITGERWEYSNTGYLFLASIVEKVSGMHFRDFLKETIFEPLNMNNTVLYKYQINSDPNMPNRVFGYKKALNQVDLELNDYNIVNDVRGDGGIYSTLQDLYKWNQALVNNTIIPKRYLDDAFTSGVLNNGELTRYGFGWEIQSKSGEPKIINHSGGWVGFETFLHNEVDTNNGFILLTNNSGENFDAILDGLFNIIEGKPYVIPKYQIEKEMAKKILGEDIDKGIRVYHELKSDTIQYSTSEGTINGLGYRLLGEDKIDAALEVFKLNTEEYPKSANTYDSYGDALIKKGDSINALKNYKRCFKIDSTLSYAYDKALKLEKVLNLKK